jgi:type VI secretion system secreted protein Hcp
MGAFDAFLKLTDIKGETQDSKHTDEIEIDSYSWGAVQTGTSSFGGGAGSGKIDMHDFHFTKKIDCSTPALFQSIAKGKPITEAKLTLRKAGGDQQEYLIVSFKNVTVSSVQQSGHSQGTQIPMESITLNFEEVKYEYKKQEADGSVKPAGEFAWNLKKNAPA